MGFVSLLDLPIHLLMPPSLSSIKEIALKTIPHATKTDIKNVLEARYGFEVEKVRTLNMKGKKKNKGGWMVAKSNYKKAYVTLKRPLSISQDSFLQSTKIKESVELATQVALAP